MPKTAMSLASGDLSGLPKPLKISSFAEARDENFAVVGSKGGESAPGRRVSRVWGRFGGEVVVTPPTSGKA